MTEQQQSEILRLIMENTQPELQKQGSGMKPIQILKNASCSKVQTIDQNSDTRKRSIFDPKQVPYKMDYTDGRGQSAKAGMLSMTTASSRHESSQIPQRRVVSNSNR